MNPPLSTAPPAEPAAADAPYPTLRTAMRHKHAVTFGAAIMVAALGIWAGWRSGYPEVYAFALAAAVAMRFVVAAALEVVELVAETLMPR